MNKGGFMNRRILMAIGLSFLTVWVMQYFMGRKDGSGPGGQVAPGQVQSGQFYSALSKPTWHTELKREIDFVDVSIKPSAEQVLAVETPLYNISFSNFGGVIKALSYKKHTGKDDRSLQTINSNTLDNREEGCFLLAFDEKTPYMYKFVSHNISPEDASQSIVYQAEHDGWRVKKTYLINEKTYKIDILFDFEMIKKDAKPISPRLFFPAPAMGEVDPIGKSYWNPANASQMSGVMSRNGVRIEKVSQKQELGGIWGLPEIFGGEDKYFAHTLIKDEKNFSQGGYYKRVNKKLFAILSGPEIKENKNYKISFYVGPKALSALSAVDKRLEDLLAFGWLSAICKLLLRLLEFLYKYLGNFGLAIILLTILLKLPFVPLSISSRKKMERYQKFQPTIQRIRAKYKTDLRKQQEEILRFHKEHNLSPATPAIGCLPLLFQLPILFALYRVLGNYLSLYHAPFFGWIQDLSARDPYYVLPILMGATMIWQQRMNPTGDEKQRMMMLFMPVVMTAVFINFPAGLVLYWFMSNLLGVLEDILRRKVFS